MSSLPRFRARLRPVSHFQLADLRELCTAGEARLLQRRDIPSNHRRMSITSRLPRPCLSSLKGFYGPGRRPDRDRQRRYQHIRSKVVRRTSSSWPTTPARLHRIAHPFHPSDDEIHPEVRFTGAGILAMANSGPNTNGSFRFRFVLATALLPSRAIKHSQRSHTIWLFSRFAVLYDSGSDAVFGQQAHDIWPREQRDARRAAPGGSRRRRTGSVCICTFIFFFFGLVVVGFD